MQVLTQFELLSPPSLFRADDGKPFTFLLTVKHTLAVQIEAVGTLIHAFKYRRRRLTHHRRTAASLPDPAFQALYLQKFVPDFTLRTLQHIVAWLAFISADGAHVVATPDTVRQEQVGVWNNRGSVTFQLAVDFRKRPHPVFEAGQPRAQSLKLGWWHTRDGAAFQKVGAFRAGEVCIVHQRPVRDATVKKRAAHIPVPEPSRTCEQNLLLNGPEVLPAPGLKGKSPLTGDGTLHVTWAAGGTVHHVRVVKQQWRTAVQLPTGPTDTALLATRA